MSEHTLGKPRVRIWRPKIFHYTLANPAKETTNRRTHTAEKDPRNLNPPPHPLYPINDSIYVAMFTACHKKHFY